MAVLNIVSVGLVCLVAFGAAAPQGEVLHARAKPFGYNSAQNEQTVSQFDTSRPTLRREFYQSDVQQDINNKHTVSGYRVQPAQHIKENPERRTIPSAPVIDDDRDTKQGKAPTFASPKNQQQQHVQHVVRTQPNDEADLFRKQAESAHYSFDSSVDDGINGHAHSRSETRDGLAVQGMYSYSDGFFRRTVQYEADEKGYRVIKDESEPIGDGPLIDPKGEASVRSSLGTEYTITLADIQTNSGSKTIVE